MDKQLDPELMAYFDNIKKKLKKEHEEYLTDHPEVSQLLQDFMTKLLLNKPNDVFDFTQNYFKYFEKSSLEKSLKPIIITAPSGAGKGTLISKLLKDYPHYFELSVSYTTRQPRKEDKNGVTYYFVGKEEFKKEIANNNFIEYTEYNGNYYGTLKQQVEKINKKGKICIIECEVDGAKNIFQSGLNCNFLYILPPSLEELRKRLINRGEKLKSVEKRIGITKVELEKLKDLKFVKKKIMNDELESFYCKSKEYLQELYPVLKFK